MRTYQDAFRCYEQGRLDEAVSICSQLMTAKPEDPSPLFLSGVIFRDHGQSDKALALLNRAALLGPDNSAYVLNLGIAYHMGGFFHEAKACYFRVLDMAPGQPDACNNLGKLYLDSGIHTEAVKWFQTCIENRPEYHQAYYNLGLAWQRMNNTEKASDCYEQCLSICPGHAEALNNLGIIFYQTRVFEKAEGAYRKLLTLKPNDPSALNNLGLVYRDMGRIEKAVSLFGKVLEKNPDNLEALSNYLEQAGYACLWEERDRCRAQLREKAARALADGRDPGITPLAAFRLDDDPAFNLEIAAWHARKVQSFSRAEGRMHNGAGQAAGRKPGSRIRVGYVSDDLKDHAMGHILHRLFPCHDRSRFEITCYDYSGTEEDYFSRELHQGCERVVNISDLDDEGCARAISGDGIDILVDLKGYTHSHRIGIFARRPAPVQVAYLGFLGTTGAPFMDYMIADPVVIPREEEQFYSERIISLPVYQAADYSLLAPKNKRTRADWGLPQDAFVFCSFNQPYKFDAEMFRLWMNLLEKVAGSVLWLRRTSELATINLRKAAESAGVAPERLVFAGKVPLGDHLSRLSLADLALDTNGYNGGATTSNALWAGVPVVTLPGRQVVARMSASSLAAMGMDELVAADMDAYAKICLTLATDPVYHTAVRKKLLEGRDTSLIFDMNRFAGYLEKAYEIIWKRYLEGKPPQALKITQGVGPTRAAGR